MLNCYWHIIATDLIVLLNASIDHKQENSLLLIDFVLKPFFANFVDFILLFPIKMFSFADTIWTDFRDKFIEANAIRFDSINWHLSYGDDYSRVNWNSVENEFTRRKQLRTRWKSIQWSNGVFGSRVFFFFSSSM